MLTKGEKKFVWCVGFLTWVAAVVAAYEAGGWMLIACFFLWSMAHNLDRHVQ